MTVVVVVVTTSSTTTTTLVTSAACIRQAWIQSRGMTCPAYCIRQWTTMRACRSPGSTRWPPRCLPARKPGSQEGLEAWHEHASAMARGQAGSESGGGQGNRLSGQLVRLPEGKHSWEVSYLAWHGLAWPGLAWPGLACPGLAWPGLPCPALPCACQAAISSLGRRGQWQKAVALVGDMKDPSIRLVG